jgi:hypothetical protein
MDKYDKFLGHYYNACIQKDNELAHMIMNEITKKFIMDVAGGKMTPDKIKSVAQEIKKRIYKGPKIELFYS